MAECELEDQNAKVRVKFPLFCCTCSQNSETNNLILIGGGGGSSKTGIANKLFLLKSESKDGFQSFVEDFHEVNTDTEVVKCALFHPTKPLVVCGVGNASWIFAVKNHKLQIVKKIQTDFSCGEYAEQKCLAFDNSGSLLFTGGADGIVREWKFPDMEKISEINEPQQEEVDDIHIHPTGKYIVIGSKKKWTVWSLGSDRKIVQQVSTNNETFGKQKIVFKGFRFSNCGNFLFVGKAAPGIRSWIFKWTINFDTNSPWKIARSAIAHKNNHHNYLELSPDGTYLGTVTSEGTVSVFRAENLRKVMEVQTHEFFGTCCCFTEDSKNIVSVGADYSCKISNIKEQKQGLDMQLLLFLSLIVLILAIAYNFLLL